MKATLEDQQVGFFAQLTHKQKDKSIAYLQIFNLFLFQMIYARQRAASETILSSCSYFTF